MRKKKKERGSKRAAFICALILIAIFAAGGGIYYLQTYGGASGSYTPEAGTYKTTTAVRGTVAVSISESGTVTTGTQSQYFTISASSSEDETEAGEDAAQSAEEQSDAAGSEAGEAADAQGSVDTEEEVKTASADVQAGGDSSMSGMQSSDQSGSSTDSSSTDSSSDTALEIEEVLVKVGQQIEVGDPIMTVTQDSIDAYREELEAAVASAQLTVTQEEINVETKRTEAEYTYNTYLAAGETAQETYDATIASLAAAVEDAEEAVEDAQDDVDTYQYYVDLGYDYDDELEDAQETLEDAQDQLVLAQNNQTTQSIEAKQTLETALTNYNYADQLYAIDTDGLEDDLEDAQNALEDAQQALEDFNNAMADGTIYAEYAGMVMTVNYEAGDTLTEDAELITVSDAENVTITVSVTQDDISNISIGSEAQITLDAYEDETFNGTVTAIETASSMGSSTVNYNVTVTFTGDVSKIYNGMTGEVDFSVQSEDDVLYVANKAILQDGTRQYVKVLEEDGTVTEADVTTGFSNGTNVVILSGLSEGQEAIIESGLDG